MAVSKAKQGTRRKTSTKGSKGKASAAPAKDAKKPGVIAEIANILRKASEEKPVTKDEIVSKLAKAFPERGTEKMRATVGVQIPTRIQSTGIEVSSGEGGYWAS